MKNILCYLRLTRLDVSLIAFLSYVVGVKLASDILAPRSYLIAAFVSLVSYNFIYSFNAWADRRIDKINKPHRPIPAGKIAARSAYIYSVALLAASLVYPFFLTQNAFNLALFIALPVIGLAYSAKPLRLRRFFIPSVFIVSFMLIIPVMLGYFMNAGSPSAWPLFFLLFAYCLGTIPLKDIEDAPGDDMRSVENWQNKLGRRNLLRYALLVQIVNLFFLSIMPYSTNYSRLLLAIILGTLITITVFIGIKLPLTKLYKTIIWLIITEGAFFYVYFLASSPNNI